MGDEKIKSDIHPVIIAGVIFFFMLRPQEGYLQSLDFLIFLFENGLLLENIFVFEVFSLLVLFPIFILLYIFRNPIGRAINRSMHSLIAKDLIEEFDKNSDGQLSKDEAKRFFDTILEDLDESTRKSFDSDSLFEKYDSDKDGKLNENELTSLILEVFAFCQEKTIEEVQISNWDKNKDSQLQTLKDFPVSVWDSNNDAQEIVDWYNHKSGAKRSVNSLLEECNISSFNSKDDARVLLAYAKELLKASKSIDTALSDKVSPSKDEVVKLDKLYSEGYLSKERYQRLKQDLSS
ncbi:MAG: EF-hand domain-containing protein [Candidatus Poseidoniia archaeon]|nr:EF-hand domain-containing protein [Candidatus Poseidoniia archaeon]